jgi:mono/diheme cytochrome c family protein
MKPVLWFVPAAMVGLLLSVASAGECGNVVVRKVVATNVVTPAVIVEHNAVVVTPLVATFAQVVVPSYGAGFIAPAPAPMPAAAPAQTDPALLQLLQKMDQRLQRLEGQGQIPQGQAPQGQVPPQAVPMPKVDPTSAAPPVHPGARIITARCSQCHTEGNAKGGTTLVNRDGSVGPWPAETTSKTLLVAFNGDMPPASAGGKLNDEDTAQVFDFARKARK